MTTLWLYHACPAARAHVSFRMERTALLSDSQQETTALDTLRLLAARPAAAACIASLRASADSEYEMHRTKVPTQCLLAFPSLEGLDPGPSFDLVGPLEPVWQHTQLQRLSLHNRDLSGNWAGVARLSQLQQLDLGSVDLAEVVLALPALAGRLTAVTLHCYASSSSPASWLPIADLANLQSLTLYIPEMGNIAAQLPTIAPGLQSLALYAGGLTAAPPQLAACSRLARLELGTMTRGFALASLSVLSSLDSLQHLAITFFAASDVVPVILSQLSALMHLTLRAQFARGYTRLQPLTLLRELSISASGIEEQEPAQLAATLAALPALTSLSLTGGSSHCFWAPTWRAVVQMTQLRALALACCDNELLPAALSSLQALTRLSLEMSTFYTQPLGTVASLEHLRPLAGTLADLSLAGWRLTAIPPVLTALTTLTRLDRSHNTISGGWEQLRELPRLRRMKAPGQRTAPMHLHRWPTAAIIIAIASLVLGALTVVLAAMARGGRVQWWPCGACYIGMILLPRLVSRMM